MESNKPALLRDRNLYIIFSVTLLAIMGVSSLTPAFPLIIDQFNIQPRQVGYLITVFTFPGILLAPVMGVLADRYGRKTILLPSIFMFGLGGFLCTFAETYYILLFFRFIQGLGAASLGMINVTLIGDLYSDHRRATAMGYNASVLSLGTASYPAIGGALATIGWFFPFYLPLLAIPVGFFVTFSLKNPGVAGKRDLKTYFRKAWKTINVKAVWGLFLITILLFIILYGSYLTFFPLLLEQEFAAGSLTIGLVMSAMSVTTALISSQLGRLRKMFPARSILILSIFSYLLALLVIAYAGSWWMIGLGVFIFGLGHGLVIPNVQTMLVGYASIHERAIFMAFNSMVLRVGQTLGPIVIGLFYALDGLSATFLAGAGVAVVMFIVALIMVHE
jgi:MFS transporter, ACDE family, multidrug resistance protein